MSSTNYWPYNEVFNILPIHEKGQFQDGSTVTTGGNEMFSLTALNKKKKREVLKFSSEHRTDILCSVLLHRSKFSENIKDQRLQISRWECCKYSWSERLVPVILEIDLYGINQVDSVSGRIITSYLYRDIDDLIVISQNIEGRPAFAISTSGFGRLHLFTCQPGVRGDVLKKIVESARFHTGAIIRIKKDSISLEYFQLHRFGKYSSDDAITSLYEFSVHKVNSHNFKESVRRILALTDTCLVERDPSTYCIVTVKPLHEIFALVRSPTHPQVFSIEFLKGHVSSYTSTDRDALLASILDGVRASGNIDIHVKMTLTTRGHRIGPFTVPVDEETESRHLKFLYALPETWSFFDAIIRFNANCPYSGLIHSVTQGGLFSDNKENMIQNALGAFVQRDVDDKDTSKEVMEQQMQAIRRLVASKAGFGAFIQTPKFRDYLGIKVVKALERKDDAVTHAAIDMICALMQVSIIYSTKSFANKNELIIL